MAPIGAKLGQNAFQVIPELSFFDVEDQKKLGFFGLNHFVLAHTLCLIHNLYISTDFISAIFNYYLP